MRGQIAQREIERWAPAFEDHISLTVAAASFVRIRQQAVQHVLVNGMTHDLGWRDVSSYVLGDAPERRPSPQIIARFVTQALGSSTVVVAEKPARSLVYLRRVICFSAEDMSFTLDSPALSKGALAKDGSGTRGS